MYAYLDENKNVVPIDKSITEFSAEEYIRFKRTFDTETRIVRQTTLNRRKHILVSTVFLGIDHGFGGTPLWFETMIFGTSLNDYQVRYATYAEAVKGHARAVRMARQARQVRAQSRMKFKKTLKRFMKRNRKILSRYM